MIETLDDYDWKEAFGYAGEPDTCAVPYQSGVSIKGAVPDKEYDLSSFTREDVTILSASSEGENDGPSWMCYGQLKDGRWFYLEAGCDYTGWDCQAGGSTTIASDREECIRFAMTDEARQRFGIELPAENIDLK